MGFEERILDCLEKSTSIMLDRNTKRGDAWRGSGLMGQFIEIYSMCARLRRLIWDQGLPGDTTLTTAAGVDRWKDQVIDALRDMRNFTILAEFSIEEDNWKGDPGFLILGEYMGKKGDIGGD